MHLVMIDIPTKLQDLLTLKFLSLGLELYIGENAKAVQDIIEKKGAGYLFVRINQLSSPWLTYLARLRQYKDENDLKIIILSDKTDREFIQTLLLLNVVSLIPGNIDDEEIYKRLHKLVTLNDFNNEKREYQRVTPREDDEITLNISVPNSKTFLTGKVINVSIGGVALQLENVGDARWLSVGQIIESAQIRINRKIGITGLKIVGIKDNVVGGRFVRSSDYFFNLLGRYLLERLSKG